MGIRLLLLLLGVTLGTPALLPGQEALDEVESLLSRGMVYQARDRLAEWWESDRIQAGRTELQRGIWLRGKLTVDPDLAALDYRRLTVEFPGGPYTDDALLRLAQAAESRGDLPGALTHYQALARDYPASNLRGRAQDWLREHGEEAERLAAQEEAADPTPPPVSRLPAAGPEIDGGIALQVGAFRNPDGARRLLSELTDAGFEARLVRVPGSPLVRVRVGYFRARTEAQDLREALRRGGWDSTIVTDAREEERVG